jgi:ABC-type lipoprotein release transport system permease subunit
MNAVAIILLILIVAVLALGFSHAVLLNHVAEIKAELANMKALGRKKG